MYATYCRLNVCCMDHDDIVKAKALKLVSAKARNDPAKAEMVAEFLKHILKEHHNARECFRQYRF